VDAVADCFAGQPKREGLNYRVDPGRAVDATGQAVAALETVGFKNADLALTPGQMLENIHAVQRRQNLPLSAALVKTKVCDINLDVEMETGTGKDARRIYEELDDFQSRRPIDVISANRPILFLDEPQKVEGGKTLETLANFKPLAVLRYSATHKTTHNQIHRLDALDAYNQKLVKKIAVRGISVKGLTGTNAYLYLESIEVSTAAPVARVELEVNPNKKGRCMPKTVLKPKGTDWPRVRREAAADAPIPHAATDDPYDPNDDAAVAAYWQQATVTRGRGRPPVAVKRPTLNMRVDAEVLTAFKATGPGWQTRINAVLREAVANGVKAA